MKAIIQGEYGSPEEVLELRDVDDPVPGDNEVLVRVHAAGVQAGDWHVVEGQPYVMRIMGFGLRKPKNRNPGFDVAGKVTAVGTKATQFQLDDDVFGWCKGAFAEYVAVPQDALVTKPASLTFEQAAVVPSSAFTALQGLRDHGKVQRGQKVLVNGASGGVGTFAVQIAKSFGADVTGVCNTRNVDMVRTIGADHVIDYTQEDYTKGDERYDVILDIAANHSLSKCRGVLTPKGTYVLIGDSGGRWLGGLSRFIKTSVLSPFVSQRMRAFVSKPSKADLLALKELLEAGEVTPIIDRTYPLDETPEAIGYVEKGHARAKVAVTV